MAKSYNTMLAALAATMLLLSCLNQKNPSTQPAATLLAQTARAENSQQKPEQQAAKAKKLYEIPAPLKDRPEQILWRKGYTVSYNKTTRTANWVAWHLTKSHTYGRFLRSKEVFTEDTSVPEPRATDGDYYNSRYDRGHMCPAGDSKWDSEAMTESFLLTNVCPQNHGLNKYEWNEVENLCRNWARQYDAVDVVCGPVYNNGTGTYRLGNKQQLHKTIGRNAVAVPDAFFKVVLCRSGKAKAIGFVFRNDGKTQPLEQAVRTVDQVEELTGIDFFPALDDKTENAIEATASLDNW